MEPTQPTTTTDSAADHASLCSSSNLSATQASSERDSEDYYADIGFMFDGFQPSTLRRFVWSNTSGTTQQKKPSSVRVAVHVVEGEPGAVQSGHYLWDGAPALTEYLMEGGVQSATQLLELGCGSSLVSLAALQLMHKTLQCVVVTDHDPGTLERSRDNYETTMEELLDSTPTEEEQFDCINGVGSVPILFENLEWGDLDAAQQVAQAATDQSSPLQFQDPIPGRTNLEGNQEPNVNYTAERNVFDLILGSDLIYCESVVLPLFQTVSCFMAPGGAFLLSQSMVYDEAIEHKIEEACQVFNLERSILRDSLKDKASNRARIQQFVRKAPDQARAIDEASGRTD